MQFKFHAYPGWSYSPLRFSDKQTSPLKKVLREIQTLRAGCSKAEPKIFAPLQTFQGAQDGQNLISWRWSLPLPINPVWWRPMHVISSYRGNRPTHKATNKATNTQTHRQDQLQYTVPQLARSVITTRYTEAGSLWCCCKISQSLSGLARSKCKHCLDNIRNEVMLSLMYIRLNTTNALISLGTEI